MNAAVSTEDLVAIADEVWSAFLATDDVAPPSPSAESDPSDLADRMNASVGVHGDWDGLVVLELSVVAATALAGRMLGLDELEAGDVTDAVGELVNVVGGNVKSLVPGHSTLGLPVVVEGALGGSTPLGAVEVCGADLDWAGHDVRVSVWTSAGLS